MDAVNGDGDDENDGDAGITKQRMGIRTVFVRPTHKRDFGCCLFARNRCRVGKEWLETVRRSIVPAYWKCLTKFGDPKIARNRCPRKPTSNKRKSTRKVERGEKGHEASVRLMRLHCVRPRTEDCRRVIGHLTHRKDDGSYYGRTANQLPDFSPM